MFVVRFTFSIQLNVLLAKLMEKFQDCLDTYEFITKWIMGIPIVANPATI